MLVRTWYEELTPRDLKEVDLAQNQEPVTLEISQPLLLLPIVQGPT